MTDGFVVFAGSKASQSTVPSLPKSLKAMRDELIENNILNLKDDAFVFEKDFLFSSPSSAAAVIMGRSANGLKEWKDKSGRELSWVESIEVMGG